MTLNNSRFEREKQTPGITTTENICCFKVMPSPWQNDENNYQKNKQK
jgi:hypothetical protein